MNAFRRISTVLVASVALAGCGAEADVAVQGAPSSPQAASPAGLSKPSDTVSAFLAKAQADMVDACNKVRAAAPNDGPPPTLKSIEQNGFVPVIGPTCDAGYAVSSPANNAGSSAAAGLEIREKPDMNSAVIGYMIPGNPGWVSIAQITEAGLTVDEILAAR